MSLFLSRLRPLRSPTFVVPKRHRTLRRWLAVTAISFFFVASSMPSVAAASGRVTATHEAGSIVLAANRDNQPWVKLFSAGAWGSWLPLGGAVQGEPQVISWGANHADVYIRGTDNGLYHRWWNGTSWAEWERIGNWQITSDPEVISWGYGRVDVFARGTDGALIHTFFDGSSWRGWEHLGGGIAGKPAAYSWTPGHIGVLVRGTDNRLYQRWIANGQPGWAPWELLGLWQMNTDPVVKSWGYGRVDVFTRGLDNALIHTFFDGTAWRGWESLGGVLSSGPTVASYQGGHLDIYVRGTDLRLYHRWYTPGTGWSGWEGIGAWQMADEPDVISWGSGHLDVYATGLDGHAIHAWFSASGGWQPWESLGSPTIDTPVLVDQGTTWGAIEAPTAADTAILDDDVAPDGPTGRAYDVRGCRRGTARMAVKSSFGFTHGWVDHVFRFCWNKSKKKTGFGGINYIQFVPSAYGAMYGYRVVQGAAYETRASWGGSSWGAISIERLGELKMCPVGLGCVQSWPLRRSVEGHFDGTARNTTPKLR